MSDNKLTLMKLDFTWPIALSLDLANIFMFSLTIIALWFTFQQFSKEKRRDREIQKRYKEEDDKYKKIQMEASAKILYMEYLKIAFANPTFAVGKYVRDDKESETQYDTYLSIVLWTFDECMSLDEKSYIPALEGELELHEEYIRRTLHHSASDLKYRNGYSNRMIAIIDAFYDKLDANCKANQTTTQSEPP